MSKPKNMTPEQEADHKRRCAEASRRWREKNPDKAKDAFRRWHREWAEKNPEKVKELKKISAKRLRDRDPEVAREKEKAKRSRNPQRFREYAKRYYHANKERVLEMRRARGVVYRTEEYNAWHREYQKLKYAENIDRERAKKQRMRSLHGARWNAGEKKKREALADSYIAERLGLPLSRIPKDLMELKRITLKTTRILKQIKKHTDENTN